VKRQNPSIVVFEQGLVVVPVSYSEDFSVHLPVKNLLTVQTAGIGERYEQIEANGLEIVTHLSEWGQSGTRYFRCLDPDGNIVEVFSSDGA
jgi:predicted enzyme related to lactoylglutathione lyase